MKYGSLGIATSFQAAGVKYKSHSDVANLVTLVNKRLLANYALFTACNLHPQCPG